MTIDVSPEVEIQLKAKARAEGLSPGASVERLIIETESRRVRLAAFQQVIEERVASLANGETVDGEEVMGRLIRELDAPARSPSMR